VAEYVSLCQEINSETTPNSRVIIIVGSRSGERVCSLTEPWRRRIVGSSARLRRHGRVSEAEEASTHCDSLIQMCAKAMGMDEAQMLKTKGIFSSEVVSAF
jgi:hypothetical protein